MRFAQEKADYEIVDKCWADGLDRGSDGIFFFIGDAGVNFDSWAAAREFTDERLEEIRQIEAEMVTLDTFIGGAAAVLLEAHKKGTDIRPIIVTRVRLNRTFRRLEAALAELKRGMKI